MKRLTPEQKKRIEELHTEKSVKEIAEEIKASRQTVNYYFLANGWERKTDVYFLTDSDKQFITDHHKELTVPQMALKLFGVSNDVTRTRIYGYAKKMGYIQRKTAERKPANIRPGIVEMIRQAAEKYKKAS